MHPTSARFISQILHPSGTPAETPVPSGRAPRDAHAILRQIVRPGPAVIAAKGTVRIDEVRIPLPTPA